MNHFYNIFCGKYGSLFPMTVCTVCHLLIVIFLFIICARVLFPVFTCNSGEAERKYCITCCGVNWKMAYNKTPRIMQCCPWNSIVYWGFYVICVCAWYSNSLFFMCLDVCEGYGGMEKRRENPYSFWRWWHVLQCMSRIFDQPNYWIHNKVFIHFGEQIYTGPSMWKWLLFMTRTITSVHDCIPIQCKALCTHRMFARVVTIGFYWFTRYGAQVTRSHWRTHNEFTYESD